MNLKRILCLLTALCLLLGMVTGCSSKEDSTAESTAAPEEGGAAPAESTAFGQEATPAEPTELLQLTEADFPVLDGSTSMVPLGQAIAAVVLQQDPDTAASLISFNKTTQSLRNLMNGQCDLVIAAEPDSAVFDEMADAGFGYEQETIAKEALVFVVNQDNPVNSLTAEQVRGIYSGEITNWAQVGGNDQPIEAFQRNEGSGSQVMMEKLVMQDTPMAAGAEGYVIDEMGTLISAVKSYDNSANAIGYTVYYYANDMNMADGLKILAIDGVTPCAETLRSGEYPWLNGYYAFLPASAAEDSPARLLYNWLLTDDGQYLLEREGYVAVNALPEDYDPTACTGGLLVDFTLLDAMADNDGAVYTRLSDGPLNDLTASPDYGTIYPYAGVPMYDSYIDENGETVTYASGYLCGFMDESGRLLTDPVYSRAEIMTDYMSVYTNGFEKHLPFWRYGKIMSATTNEDGWAEGEILYGFATLDGSFATDCIYDTVYVTGDYIIACESIEDCIFSIYDMDCNLVLSSDQLSFADRLSADSAYLQYGDGLFAITLTDGTWYMDISGNLVLGPYHYAAAFSNGWASVTLQDDTEALINTEGDIMDIPDMFDATGYLTGGLCEVMLNSGEYLLINQAGETVLSSNQSISSWSYGWILWDDENTTYYTWDGTLCYGGPISYEDDAITPNVISRRNDSGLILTNTTTGAELTLEGAEYGSLLLTGNGETAIIKADSWDEDTGASHVWLLDEDLNILTETTDGLYSAVDNLSGEVYLIGIDDENGVYTVYGTDMTAVAILSGVPEIYGSKLLVTDESGCTLYDADGSVFFRYLFY